MKTSIAVGNRRLLKLAAFLRTVKPSRFNYNHWVGDDWKGDPKLSCGTSACALGWATTMPLFRRLGLYLTPGMQPRLGRSTAGPFAAARVLFRLRPADSYDLFLPSSDAEENATPKQVAKKIEAFVKERQKK